MAVVEQAQNSIELTSEPEDKLRVSADRNSRGYTISVRYTGNDEDEVIETVARVMKKTRDKLEEEIG